MLVDPAVWPWEGRRWAHLVSDESYDELHAFAEQLGIPRRAFQGDHYDIPTDYRERAIALGATPVPSRELGPRPAPSGGVARRGFAPSHTRARAASAVAASMLPVSPVRVTTGGP